MATPKLFVGSSVEAIEVARAIESNLRHDAAIQVWDRGIFGLSQATLEALEKVLPQYDFAVLILSGDDMVRYRGKEYAAPRDNLLFELGLFMGSLGRDRTFFVIEKGVDAEVKLPSDLHGIAPATFTRSSLGWRSDLGPACNDIRDEMKKRAVRGAVTRRLADVLPGTLAFEALWNEYDGTMRRLEKDASGVLKQIVGDNDLQRLRAGLYAGALFVARASVTGYIDAALYGNLMEIERPGDVLRVRYSSGRYNEEIITRRFPIAGRGRGVASEALATGVLQIRNDMAEELKVPGEGRLQSMASAPIETTTQCVDGTIAVLNIDCAARNAFPDPSSNEYKPFVERVGRVVSLLKRINRLGK